MTGNTDSCEKGVGLVDRNMHIEKTDVLIFEEKSRNKNK
jgi:hypothetical protein